MSEPSTPTSESTDQYPTNTVVSIIPAGSVDAAMDDLASVGIERGQIEIGSGPDHAEIVGGTPSRGVWGWIANNLPMNEEFEQRQLYVDAMAQGETVMRVQLPDEEQKHAVAQVLSRHGGTYVNFYGQWKVEALAP